MEQFNTSYLCFHIMAKKFPDYLFLVLCSVIVILIKVIADIHCKFADEETEAQGT